MNITKYEWNLSCGGMDADSHGDYYRCDDIDPLLEELETLRASNTIKQANVELLEAENERLQNNLEASGEFVNCNREDLLEFEIGQLKAENAKLIAERKEYLVNKVFESSDKKLLANHGFTDFIELLAAYEKLLAERDLYKNNCVAYECNCLSCKSTFLGEKEQHICFKCLLA